VRVKPLSSTVHSGSGSPCSAQALLTRRPNDEIVLTGHRIGLYSVIDRYQRGCTPDQSHDEFPTLEPDLIRSVIASREAHPAEMDAYVAGSRAELDRQEAASDNSSVSGWCWTMCRSPSALLFLRSSQTARFGDTISR
jgi:uncharacterized protein (DUF433 family)